MSVIPARQRDFDAKNLEDEVKQLEQNLLENEFAERLAVNSDWLALGKKYRQAVGESESDLAAFKKDYFAKPMQPADAAVLREHIMLLEGRRVNTEDFLGFPARVIEELKTARQILDVKKTELRRLRGE